MSFNIPIQATFFKSTIQLAQEPITLYNNLRLCMKGACTIKFEIPLDLSSKDITTLVQLAVLFDITIPRDVDTKEKLITVMGQDKLCFSVRQAGDIQPFTSEKLAKGFDLVFGKRGHVVIINGHIIAQANDYTLQVFNNMSFFALLKLNLNPVNKNYENKNQILENLDSFIYFFQEPLV